MLCFLICNKNPYNYPSALNATCIGSESTSTSYVLMLMIFLLLHVSSLLCASYFLKFADSECDHVPTASDQSRRVCFTNKHDESFHGSAATTPATIQHESWSEFSVDDAVRPTDVLSGSKVCVWFLKGCSQWGKIISAHTPAAEPTHPCPLLTLDLDSFGLPCLSGHYTSTPRQRGNLSSFDRQRAGKTMWIYL